ncbi:MAG TPA: rhodanese-like domain-containing protein [Jatrophihabitans sp.]|nr:rhodanese-like domain-containing protein [Jatrophihabitans sp.]
MTEFGLDDLPTIHRDEVRGEHVILDVREDSEWAAGHIEGAVHVPLDRLANRMLYEPGELLTDRPLVVTCKGGGRARRATSWLNRNGFDAVVLDGGMVGWHGTGRPMVSDTGDEPTIR